jgi:hypothetical protein
MSAAFSSTRLTKSTSWSRDSCERSVRSMHVLRAARPRVWCTTACVGHAGAQAAGLVPALTRAPLTPWRRAARTVMAPRLVQRARLFLVLGLLFGAQV